MTFSQTKYVFTVGVHLNTLGKNSPTYKNDNKNALGARDYKPIISCLRDIHNVFFFEKKVPHFGSGHLLLELIVGVYLLDEMLI